MAAGRDNIVSIPCGLLPTEVMEVAGLCFPLPVGDACPCVIVDKGTLILGNCMPPAVCCCCCCCW